MSRHQTLARIAAERRDDARAETRLKLGVRERAYLGGTPLDAHPKYQVCYTIGEHATRVRRGRVERRGGKLKFRPTHDEGER